MLKYIQPSSTLGTEVSKALEGAEPVAFPLNSQYVKSMKKANCKTGDEVSTSQVSEVNPVEGKRRGTWNYSEVKSNFMDALKKDGFSYRDRVAKWDESDEKKDLLGSLSLPELKKRRFVDKSCEKNTWA